MELLCINRSVKNCFAILLLRRQPGFAPRVGAAAYEKESLDRVVGHDTLTLCVIHSPTYPTLLLRARFFGASAISSAVSSCPAAATAVATCAGLRFSARLFFSASMMSITGAM